MDVRDPVGRPGYAASHVEVRDPVGTPGYKVASFVLHSSGVSLRNLVRGAGVVDMPAFLSSPLVVYGYFTTPQCHHDRP